MQRLEKMLFFALAKNEFQVSLSCATTIFYFVDLADYLMMTQGFETIAHQVGDQMLLIDKANKMVKQVPTNSDLIKSIYGCDILPLNL